LVILHREQEAARLLGLSARTLQRFRKDGCGPQFIRRGRRGIGYTDEAIVDWIAQHTHASIAGECAAAEKRDSHGEAGLNQGG
jgi:predicted DNA-binding transcriptional regulator AlpA